MNDKERAEHQQAHRAAIEGGMLPSYGDPRTERADALELAQQVMDGKHAKGHSYEKVHRLAAALLATNEELSRLRRVNEEAAAQIVRRDDFIEQLREDLRRCLPVAKEKTKAERDSAQSEVAQLKAELSRIKAATVTMYNGLEWYAGHEPGGQVARAALETLRAALSEAPATEGSGNNG